MPGRRPALVQLSRGVEVAWAEADRDDAAGGTGLFDKRLELTLARGIDERLNGDVVPVPDASRAVRSMSVVQGCPRHVAGREDRARPLLRLLDVRLVERVDAEDGAGDRRRPARSGRTRRRGRPARRARSRRAAGRRRPRTPRLRARAPGLPCPSTRRSAARARVRSLPDSRRRPCRVPVPSPPRAPGRARDPDSRRRGGRRRASPRRARAARRRRRQRAPPGRARRPTAPSSGRRSSAPRRRLRRRAPSRAARATSRGR